MRSTIDKAGRLVIPKALRERVGLVPGPVELYAEGMSLRVEAVAGEGLTERAGRLVIPSSGLILDDEGVHRMREDAQK